MQTRHEVIVGDARSMDRIDDGSVELVVTSPPYPMIEMWDGTFADLDPEIEARLGAGDGWGAFERMHRVLGEVWDEVWRVLTDGGIACVNVGDATRTVGGEFALYPNHAAVVDAFRERGFTPLPDVLWRKPTNSAAKFMGSGTLPPNAYVTLEHEYVLVFRKGEPRSFPPGDDRRYESAYFWEERNEWFSDVWTDVTGAVQSLDGEELRERSGAFPVEIPYRLVNMYAVYGDTVLDPFWGTGTTTLAAMLCGRNSVGYEIEPGLVEAFEERVDGIAAAAEETCRSRLEAHRRFVDERRRDGEEPAYEAEHYDVPVVTKQERRIRLYGIESIRQSESGYEVQHEPFVPDG